MKCNTSVGRIHDNNPFLYSADHAIVNGRDGEAEKARIW